jgi:ABC-type Fe3+ transport system permease subunit
MVSAARLLRPAGFDALVTRVRDAASTGHCGDAAMPALRLLVVSGRSMDLLCQE